MTYTPHSRRLIGELDRTTYTPRPVAAIAIGIVAGALIAGVSIVLSPNPSPMDDSHPHCDSVLPRVYCGDDITYPDPSVFPYRAPVEGVLQYTPRDSYTVTVPIATPAPRVSAPVETPAVDWTRGLPACEFEDSVDCYWDAANFGNGQGSSFVNVGGEIYYR